MKTNELDANKLLERINDAAEAGVGLTFTAAEIKVLSRDLGELLFIPVFDETKIQKIINNVEIIKEI